MSGKMKWIVAGLLVVTLLAVGIGGSVALAQGPKPPTGGKGWMQLYWDALAKKLGVPTDKLQQAMTDARKDALDQAVKQGLLTQTQADQMSKLGQNRAAFAAGATARLDAAAKTLGMSVDDLKTALRTKTLLTLAQEKKVDVAKLRTAIADAEKAAIDQAVKDGKLTQAQADELKAKITPENIDLNRQFWGSPMANRFKDQIKQRFDNRLGKPGRGTFPSLPFKR
ncbi:MAG: phage protease [Anaerolineales bacterium]|nr:phage protease [Anaerolineales bacterium]